VLCLLQGNDAEEVLDGLHFGRSAADGDDWPSLPATLRVGECVAFERDAAHSVPTRRRDTDRIAVVAMYNY
jgi:hypothetical protein